MTSTEQQRVEEIAKGLTKAQRKSILDATWSKGDGVWHPEGWYTARADKRVRRGLCRNRLIRDYLRSSYRLTPLGLAVRTHLQGQAS